MNWEKVSLECICTMLSGNAWAASKFKDEGKIPIIRIQNLGNNENEKFIWWDESYEEKFIVTKGDILLSLSGSIKVDVWNGRDALLNQRIVKLIPNKDVDQKWFFWQITNIILDIERMGKWALVNNVSITDLKDLKIPLPPLDVQKRIAAILDAADALRRKDQELLKKYDELAQAIFIDMFGDPVKNEMGWEINKLGNITHLITDGKHGNCSDEENSGYYFISAKDIYNDKINYSNSRQIPFHEFEEVDRRTNLQAGDIVMVNTGATIGKLAIAEYCSETRKTTFQKSVAVIKVNHVFVLPEFLKYVFVLRIKNFASKGTGSAVQNLLLSEMRDFKIICPPIQKQELFKKRISCLSEQKEITSSIDSKSNLLFNSLLQKAFKGELVA